MPDTITCERCGKFLPKDADLQEHTFCVGSANNTKILCRHCLDKLTNLINEDVEQFTGVPEFKQAAELILAGIERLGFPLDDENFKDTPNRFARAYFEIFKGCININAQVSDILSTSFPADGRDDMVVAKDIVVFSMCPHHILPVEYHVQVGYIPSEDGRVLGISKLGRLVDILAKRPMLQEEFTHEIVDKLQAIHVQGAIALIEGQHMCMRMRGARTRETTITTTALSGVFKRDDGAKQEFMTNIADRRSFH